jgi:long-chain fatty acid transport protein
LGAAAAGHVFVSKVVENLINELYERYRSGEKMTIGNQKKDRRGRIIITCHLAGALFSILFLGLPCLSTAGGLYLNEFGTPSMGVAGAGANAVASDASTSFHNAAGMTRIKGKELMGTGGLLNATVKFDPDRQRFA